MQKTRWINVGRSIQDITAATNATHKSSDQIKRGSVELDHDDAFAHPKASISNLGKLPLVNQNRRRLHTDASKFLICVRTASTYRRSQREVT